MIVRNRRKRSRLLSRLSSTLSRITPPAGQQILSTEHFQLEIDKEIQRANRRKTNPEFALITMDFCDHKVPDEKLNALIDVFQERLRVSDSVGWHQMKLAALLPETDQQGASEVCNSLLEMARANQIELDATVSIYPWDDRLLGHNQKQNENGFDNSTSTDWEDPQSDDVMHCESNGGVATMAPPKTRTSAPPRLQGGTGVHTIFSKSEATPIWKRAVDVAGAGVGLMLLTPVFLAAAVAIKATSRGPVFFLQEREGKDGETFKILKFRTMCVDAEARKADLRKLSEQDGPAFKLTNDPRVTKVGKYLSCLLYTSPSPRDRTRSRMPSSA